MLPFISFTDHLNKQQIVTQNLKKNPTFLDINMLSLLSEPKLDSTNKYLIKISSHLWTQLVSCYVRQKQHRDYSASSYPITFFYKMPSSVLAARFLSSIEFNFDTKILSDNLSLDKNVTSTIELKSLESFSDTIKNEWYSMCQMFMMLYELQQELIKHPSLKEKIQVKTLDLKRLVVFYGPSLLFKLQLEWNKETKLYDIILGVNKQASKTQTKQTKVDIQSNPHNLFVNEIKQFFYKNQSLLMLVQLLNKTCTFAYALKRLLNLPRVNAKFVLNQSFLAFSNFMLIVYALNHVRLTFNSKYWIDIQMDLKTSVLSLRDSYFEVLDTKKEAEYFNLMRFLNVSLR